MLLAAVSKYMYGILRPRAPQNTLVSLGHSVCCVKLFYPLGTVIIRSRFFKQIWNFDFFNYAGILRPVYITRKPFAYIEDISIEARADGKFNLVLLEQINE